MKKKTPFVLCINNQGYEVSLELLKLYEVTGKENVENTSFIRVIDESGKDYLYPEDFFVPIQLPKPTLEAIAATRH